MLQPLAAHATFSGDYAPANWETALTTPLFASDLGNGGTTFPVGDTQVYLNAAYNSAGYVFYTIHTTTPGTVAFSYTYTPDTNSVFGAAGIVQNNPGNDVISGNSLFEVVHTGQIPSGGGQFDVLANSLIGFYVYADDVSTYEASAQFLISSFRFFPSTTVPEPSSLWLLAAGAATFTKRLRKTQK
jgi:hypothetical protein